MEKTMSLIRKAAAVALVAALPSLASGADNDWQARVAEALGKSGTAMPGNIYRVGLPRTDIKATLDGIELKPGFALGGWLAFEEAGAQSMVMGDLVLTAEEVNPVMEKLLAGGIQVTALHNHLLRNQPFTMYMHVMGMGDPVSLATVLHDALAVSKTPLAVTATGTSQPAAAAPAAPPPIDLDTAALDRIFGTKGANNGGIYQFSIPRAEQVKDGNMAVPPSLGSAQAINFQPLGGGKAAITGDFVLTAKEVPLVMKALRGNGIEVTALHNHMLDDQPRLFFMHFWANDDAGNVAQGLKTALDQVNINHG